MSNTVIYKVDINTSADSVTGLGTDLSPFNYSQFLSKLAINDETNYKNYFFLKGFRSITDTGSDGVENRWVTSKSYTEIDAWGNEPWRIDCASDFYLESITDWTNKVVIKNGMIKCGPLSLKFSVSTDNLDITFDNCWIRGNLDDGLDSRFSGGIINFINCTLQDFVIFLKNFNYLNFVNSIIYNSISNPYYLIQHTVYLDLKFNNVTSNRWIYEPTSAVNYNVVNPTGSNFTISLFENSDGYWDVTTVPDAFTKDLSAISTDDISYISSGFSAINISGDTSYSGTWYNGQRDGIGALYFPILDNFVISASSSVSPLSSTLYFKISGTDDYGFLDKVKVDYDFGNGVVSADVLANEIVQCDFNTVGLFDVSSKIYSFNKWYDIDSSLEVLIGSLVVDITIYDKLTNNDVTGGTVKPLKDLRFEATFDEIQPTLCIWDLDEGDNLIGNNLNYSYRSEGLKNISLSAFYSDQLSAVSSVSLNVSATSAEYFVNITSAYDSNTSHLGTLEDPFSWAEFKGMVETSGEYLDTYRLSGSRTLSANPSNRYVLNIDRRKMFTIRDWDVSAYGPWVLEVQDFSVLDQNSILSAAGCILKNGIIYNKPYSSPARGGQIIFGTTYDMFIVYQGFYSKIVIDPYMNIFSGGSAITSADAKIIGSTIYLSGSNWWQDLFLSADFSGTTGQTKYTFEVTDSVITNLKRFDTRYFCKDSTNVILSNSTFNRSSADISADFEDNFTDCQFDWNPPEDYPFTPDNDLYGKDIDYILANKKKLRPFTNITFPPNPGKNAPTYLGYETGLFGYPRNEYNTSGF